MTSQQQGEGFLSSDLADNESVGFIRRALIASSFIPNSPAASTLAGTAFEVDVVGVKVSEPVEAEFQGVLHGDEAAHERRLLGSGTAGDDDVETGQHHRFEQMEERLGDGAEIDQLFEPADVEVVAADRDGWPA